MYKWAQSKDFTGWKRVWGSVSHKLFRILQLFLPELSRYDWNCTFMAKQGEIKHLRTRAPINTWIRRQLTDKAMTFWWLGTSFAILLIFTFTTVVHVDEQTSTDKCLFPRIHIWIGFSCMLWKLWLLSSELKWTAAALHQVACRAAS